MKRSTTSRRIRVEQIESGRRFVLLGGPGGYLTMVPAGSRFQRDQYRDWTELLRVNVPRGRGLPDWWTIRDLAGAAKQWALDVYGGAA